MGYLLKDWLTLIIKKKDILDPKWLVNHKTGYKVTERENRGGHEQPCGIRTGSGSALLVST